MRSALIGLLLALFWGLASAQTNNETLPACADTCAAGFATPGQFNGCNGQNIACICSNSTFISNIACCLSAKCDSSDQAIAAAYAKQLCGANGVTVPDAVSCLTGSPTATPSATGSSSNLSAATTAPTTASTASSTATSSSKGAAGTHNAGAGAGLAGGLLALLAFLG